MCIFKKVEQLQLNLKWTFHFLLCCVTEHRPTVMSFIQTQLNTPTLRPLWCYLVCSIAFLFKVYVIKEWQKKRILLFYHLLWILIFENACSQMQEMYKYPFLAKELKQPVKVSCTLKPTHSLVLFIWHGGRRLFSSKGSTDVRWRFLKGCKLDDNWIHFAEAEITDVSK